MADEDRRDKRDTDDADRFIPPHGGYLKLHSYQKAVVVYEATVYFCARFLEKHDRTYDQMVQAARSGKQNIVEGSQVSGTSKELEIKLTNVARASLEELLKTPFSPSVSWSVVPPGRHAAHKARPSRYRPAAS